MKENDKDIRTTLSIETERKNEMDETEESMYDREIISLIIQKNYCFFQNRLISVPFLNLQHLLIYQILLSISLLMHKTNVWSLY